MRMWMLPPRFLCRRHLLGEHVEIHMLAGSLRQGRDVSGWTERRQVFPSRMVTRHEALTKEMAARGYRHCSPLPNAPPWHGVELASDTEANLEDLCRRCTTCAERVAHIYNTLEE